MKSGTVFIPRNPGSPERVWIVAASDTSGLVIFPLKKCRGHGRDDVSCVLRSAHPDAPGDWVVSYEEGRPLPDEKLAYMQKHGFIELRESFSEEHTVLIQRGATISEFTPKRLKDIVAAQLPIPTGAA